MRLEDMSFTDYLMAECDLRERQRKERMKQKEFEKYAKEHNIFYCTKELQEPCDDVVRRHAVLKTLDDMDNVLDEDRTVENYKELLKECYEVLPSVRPQEQTGHWIEIAYYSDGKHKIECSECGSHIFDRGHANSFNVKKKYRYCPNCGAKMVEPTCDTCEYNTAAFMPCNACDDKSEYKPQESEDKECLK